MKQNLNILLAITLFLLVSIAGAKEKWQSPAFILNAFVEVALKNEYGPDDNRIKKWQSPIRIWIDHQVGERKLHTELLEWHVEHLAEITGHSIEFVDNPEQANLTFIYTRFENMQRIVRQKLSQQIGNNAETVLFSTLCLAQVRTGNNNQIYQARIIIPADQARMHGKLVSCIVEEMTQIMGLVNDSDEAYPSIFNDRTPDELLSGLDYLLLKILYDSKITPGMHKDQVKIIAEDIISTLISNGEVEQASRKVRSGKLYELMGYR